jgi:hypothetical protein
MPDWVPSTHYGAAKYQRLMEMLVNAIQPGRGLTVRVVDGPILPAAKGATLYLPYTSPKQHDLLPIFTSLGIFGDEDNEAYSMLKRGVTVQPYDLDTLVYYVLGGFAKYRAAEEAYARAHA